MKYVEQFSIGDCVALTPEGAKAHRAHHTTQAAAAAAAVGVVAAPAVLGAGIGIAAAGTAVGVSSSAAGGVAGGVAGAAAAAFGGSPESGTAGKIITKRPRWWGQSGHDYEVRWDDGTTSWHLAAHLSRCLQS